MNYDSLQKKYLCNTITSTSLGFVERYVNRIKTY